MVKKKTPFIDRSTAAHFHLVHRSQHDPRAADPDASQRVLAPAEISANLRGASERASQSTRAWAAEQDLDGFEFPPDADAASRTAAKPAKPAKEYDGLPLPDDGYDYSQHLREMGGGVFVPAVSARGGPRSEASASLSRISRASRAAGIALRDVAEEVFESAEEVYSAVGGAVAHDTEQVTEADVDPELWAALHDDEFIDDAEEPDDDFVLQADRETELLHCPRRPRRGAGAAAPLVEEDEELHDADADADADADQVDVDVDAGAGADADVDADADADADGAILGPDDASDMDCAHEADSQHGGGGGGGAAREGDRLLDRQFARLMADYDTDEIGELDQDDPAVRGFVEIEAYEELMDDFLQKRSRDARVAALKEFRDGWDTKRTEKTHPEHAHHPAAAGPHGVGDAAAAAGGAEEGGAQAVDAKAAAAATAAAAEEEEEEEEEEDPDEGIEDHPFFAGLKEPPKGDEWDAETILSTYTTTENHPTTIRVERRSKKEQIRLHPATGLPIGVSLPGSQQRQQELLAAAAMDEEGDPASDDDADDSVSGGVNRGAARVRGERGEAKRQRKQAAKEERNARRQQKKETKLAYVAERNKQLNTQQRTQQLPSTSLSRVG